MVTLSSAECGYVALSQTAPELRWVHRPAEFMGTTSGPLTVHCDNEAAKAIAELEVDTKRSRHIDIRYRYVRGLVQEGIVQVQWKPTADMIADMCTKPPEKYTIHHLWALAGCV